MGWEVPPRVGSEGWDDIAVRLGAGVLGISEGSMGIEWVTGKNRETGRAFIATADGNRVDLDIDMLPSLAVALSGLYPSVDQDEDLGDYSSEEAAVSAEREHVAHEWSN